MGYRQPSRADEFGGDGAEKCDGVRTTRVGRRGDRRVTAHARFSFVCTESDHSLAGSIRMSKPHSNRDASRQDRDKHAGGDPGGEIPKRPQDTNASGDARNDTGEDNQGRQGDRPAEDYIRH